MVALAAVNPATITTRTSAAVGPTVATAVVTPPPATSGTAEDPTAGTSTTTGVEASVTGDVEASTTGVVDAGAVVETTVQKNSANLKLSEIFLSLFTSF